MPLPLKSWFPQLVKRYLLCKGSLCSPRRRDNERIPPDPGNSLPQLDPRDGIPYWIPIPQGQALLFLKEAVRCTVMREESSGESSAGGESCHFALPLRCLVLSTCPMCPCGPSYERNVRTVMLPWELQWCIRALACSLSFPFLSEPLSLYIFRFHPRN